jgi:L,D-transpeptidase YnhG
MAAHAITASLAAAILLFSASALATKPHKNVKAEPTKQAARQRKDSDGVAEARLIEIYTLIGKGQSRDALAKATKLVDELPHFQLAQLVYGDLLAARIRPVKALGDVPDDLARSAGSTLGELREESLRRIRALREQPPAGLIPTQILALSQRSRHAIAVDASRSRLYLFENTPAGLRLVADYYISVGKAGTSKAAEGDQRTPLGVYYITSNLDKKSLKDFYGAGALPINYPNILDSKRGRTGSGIWLHGTPPTQFSRAPQSTDGCVVLANPDLEHIIRTVEVRTTPVIIASQLTWVEPHTLRNEGKLFEDSLHAWRNAKTSGDIQLILSFYTPDFTSNGKSLEQWLPQLKAEVTKAQGRTIQLKDLSYLRWKDTSDTMVVTFGEVADGIKTGLTKRQYWARDGSKWKIFFEGSV